MPAYHLVFENLHPRTLAATKRLMDARPHSQSRRKQLALMRTWLQEVSAVYGLKTPAIGFNKRAGHGIYLPEANTILMPHYSTVTLLHEFRHAMQHHTRRVKVLKLYEGDPTEEDARAWSLSLYHQVNPRGLRRLVEARKVYHLTLADLDAV